MTGIDAGADEGPVPFAGGAAPFDSRAASGQPSALPTGAAVPTGLTGEQVQDLASLLEAGQRGLDPITLRTSRAGIFALLNHAQHDGGRVDSTATPRRSSGPDDGHEDGHRHGQGDGPPGPV
jgi:hypothetical protein